ncbi:MAG: hypothetical protein ACI3T9_02190 [Romboutsia timonensis]
MFEEHDVFLQYYFMNENQKAMMTCAFFDVKTLLDEVSKKYNNCEVVKARYKEKEANVKTVGEFKEWIFWESSKEQMSLF